MWTIAFWKGAGERAIKTFFQTFGAMVAAVTGAEAMDAAPGLADIGWTDIASVSLVATILSVATSIGNADFTAGYGKPMDVGTTGRRVR